MSKSISLRVQLETFNTQAHFPDSDGTASECHGFYDWFCKDSSLKNKSRALASKLKSFVSMTSSVDLDEHYAFFKNNCPMRGPLYDDFRIVNRKTGEVVYTVVPKCGHSGEAEVWGRIGTDFGKIMSAATFKELLKSWPQRLRGDLLKS